MTLSAIEETNFRNYIVHRLMLEIERLIPEYIHTNPYLIPDIEDKGYESVEEAYVEDASNISFHWKPDPFGRS
jgi:hypothetical protein